jgi:tungstate transport system substrate-binding protein
MEVKMIRMSRLFVRSAALVAALALGVAAAPDRAVGADRFITVASTTSTENSGLFGHLLPLFEARSGVAVRVVAVGTGAALKIGEKGDADVVLVHARNAELKFVGEGFGVERREVMFNDYVIVGPKSDPAKVSGMTDVTAALQRIAAAQAPFTSRGDDSGTNKAERALWAAAVIDPKKASGTWYAELGSGMGATLNTTAEKNAYTLTDRGTWLSFRNRRDLVIQVEGDDRLRNTYGVMLVNPSRHAHVKAADGRAFIDWLISAEGRAAINGFRINGEQLFFAIGGAS